MVLSARKWAAMLAFLVVAIFAVAMTIGESEAQAATNYGAGCAQMLANPTDGNCEFYRRSRYQYLHWSNDRYANLYYGHKRQGKLRKAHIELQAARYSCHGTLYEDFSCSGRKY